MPLEVTDGNGNVTHTTYDYRYKNPTAVTQDYGGAGTRT